MANGQTIKTQPGDTCFFLRRILSTVAFLFFTTTAAHAVPVTEYHNQIRQALTALDTLAQLNETEDTAAYDLRVGETINGVRVVLPQTEAVEWNETAF